MGAPGWRCRLCSSLRAARSGLARAAHSRRARSSICWSRRGRLLLLGKPALRALMAGLAGAGVHDAKRRWERQSRWIKVLPLVAAAGSCLLIVWGRGTQPSLTLVVLHRRSSSRSTSCRRSSGSTSCPVTVLALAIVVPDPLAENWLWAGSVPIVTNPPSMDTMVIVAVYVMMALGLNMVVGYAGLLDLGYVAFFAIGAVLRCVVRVAALRAPGHRHRATEHRLQLRRRRRVRGRRRHPHLDLARAPHRGRPSRPLPACSSGCRPCGYAATTSPSSRSASARWSRRSPATATS